MTTIATKFKTAAIAAAFIAGIAGSAAAQEINPFVNGEIPKHNTPNVKTPNTGPNHGNQNRGNQFGNQYGNQFGNQNRGNQYGDPNQGNRYTTPNFTRRHTNPHSNMDMRLARYLVGTWKGQTRNGRAFMIRFHSNGRVIMGQQGSQIVMAGRYTVSQGRIRFQILATCNMSTRQCQRMGQGRITSVAFRPVDRQTLQVRTGYMRRVG